MRESTIELTDRYSSALGDYLVRRDEVDLQRAYELGRRSLAGGIGILELATVHHDALAGVLRRAGSTADLCDTVRALGGFFVESLSPYEMTHRGFRESAEALRHLHEKLEAQIRRIAHALHDEAGQLLATVHIALRDVDCHLTPAGRTHLARIYDLLGEVGGQLRHLAHEMRPPALDDLGLLPALEFLAEGVAMRAGLEVTVNGSSVGSLPLLLETAVYRIVQEALTNVAKHAAATEVSVRLSWDGQALRCVIRDNGSGFDVEAVRARRGPDRGLGLTGIQERVAALGGSLRIDSGHGTGTELDLTIPAETSDVVEHPARR
jgi:signal transduction histidine kinase